MTRRRRRTGGGSSRLLLVSPVYPPAVGGIERLAADIAARWLGQVLVVSLEEPGSAEEDTRSVVPVVRAANRPRGGRRSIARLTWLTIRQAWSYRPDVILSMHVRCAPATWVVRAITGARWVQYYHATEIPTWPYSAKLAARADAGIAVSRYTADLVSECSGADVAVIPPGVPTATRVEADDHQRRPSSPSMLTVARINDAYKGHDVVLEALPRIVESFPDLKWIVVGDGSRLAELRAEVEDRGLERHVELCGRVTDARRRELMNEASLFVLPSRIGSGGREGEGFGIVFVEAAAAGLPSVAGELGGSADAVSDGVSGLLVDATDARAVGDAVLRILGDDELRGRLSAGSLEWSTTFDWDVVYPKVETVLVGS